MFNKKSKYSKFLFLFSAFFILLLYLAALEEVSCVRPKENKMNKELINISHLISKGEDLKIVEAYLKKVTKEVEKTGLADVVIALNGNYVYGNVVTIKAVGYIKADTYGRRILNKTKVPYKGAIDILVGK